MTSFFNVRPREGGRVGVPVTRRASGTMQQGYSHGMGQGMSYDDFVMMAYQRYAAGSPGQPMQPMQPSQLALGLQLPRRERPTRPRVA